MQNEMFLRDDIIELSSKLDAQCFNVKAYRKRSSVTSSRNSKKPFIIGGQVAASSEVQSTKYDGSAEKSQRVTEVLSSKRLSVTAGVRKRSHVSDSMNQNMTRTAMSKPNNCIDEVDEQGIQRDNILLRSKNFIGHVSEKKQNFKKQNKFASLEKKYSKGGVKDKHIENWLNQVLIEYCSQEKFDPTIQNSALKKFGIDKNTMLSKGIGIDNLGRLYKSLFVYSMGFNNLLKEVCSKNMNLKKTIWKVYAILLQYCAEGGFQTMIGQIQRDKARKLESLKEQIQKRQNIINNNEQANQERNAKIFKEIKILKQENRNLENDKIVILQDFKQTQQAFNQEVSLRLRFQNKINEIHGVHRQLMIKLERLYEDFKIKITQNSALQEKLNKLNEKHTVLTNDNIFANKELNEIKKQNKYNNQLIGELKQAIKSLQYGNIQNKNAKLELMAVIAQKQRKNSQLVLEMQNVELMLKMIDDSQKQLKKEYDKSLEDNQKLVTTIHEQMVQINELLANKKSFNDQHAAMEAHIQLEKQKNQEKKQEIQGLKNKINELKDLIDEKDVYIGSLENINESLKKDLEDCYKKIEEMKRVKDILEDDLVEYKKKDETYNIIFHQKQKTIELLTAEKQNLQQELAEFVIMKKSLQTKIGLLNQKLTSTEELNKKKIEKYKEEVTGLRAENEKYKTQWTSKVAELQKYIKLYEDTFGKLRNELFERGDLQLRYKQSLTVVESQTSHIKDLTIKISEYIERDQEQSRKIKNLEYIVVSKEKLYKTEIELRDKNIQKYLSQIKQSKGYVHPMLYEDALSMIQRQSTKSKSLINQLTANLKKQTIQKAKIQKQSQKSVQQIKDLLNKYQIQMNKKNMELQYQKQKAKNMKSKLQEIELTMQGTKSGGGSSSTGSFREKQKKYLDIIKQKSTEIEEMIKQAEKMHDHNNELLISLNKAETELKQNNQVLIPLKQHIAQMEAKVQELEEEKLNMQKQYQNIQNKYDSSEKKKSSQNQEDKSQFSGQNKSKQTQRNQQSRSNQHSAQEKNIDSHHQNQEKTSQNLGWRNDLGKKIRNAYQYYHK